MTENHECVFVLMFLVDDLIGDNERRSYGNEQKSLFALNFDDGSVEMGKLSE